MGMGRKFWIAELGRERRLLGVLEALGESGAAAARRTRMRVGEIEDYLERERSSRSWGLLHYFDEWSGYGVREPSL